MSGYVLMPSIAVACVGLALVWLAVVPEDKDVVGLLGLAVLVTGALVCGLIGVIVPVQRAVERTACERYGRQTEREVRFVNYAYKDWDCLVRTTGGRWVSKDDTREVGP